MRTAGILAIVLGVALACIAVMGSGARTQKQSLAELQAQFDPEHPDQPQDEALTAAAMPTATMYRFVAAGVAVAAGALLLRQSRQ